MQPLSSTDPQTAVHERDKVLIRRIARRDRAAFEELYRAYYPRLLRYLLRQVSDHEMAEEILNDVMMVVWEKAPSFKERSRASTWVLGIARYRALQALRGRSRRPRSVELERAEEGLQVRQTPDDRSRELRMSLSKALRSLSPAQRAVVELTYYYGYSYKDIAEITGCPVNTVKTRMFHARKRLRVALPRLGLHFREEN